MAQGQAARVQGGTRYQGRFDAVEPVAQQRAAHVRHMHPQLMGSPRARAQPHERQRGRVRHGQSLVSRDSLRAVRAHHARHNGAFVAAYGQIYDALRRLRAPRANGAILAAVRAAVQDAPQAVVDIAAFRHYHNARRAPV